MYWFEGCTTSSPSFRPWRLHVHHAGVALSSRKGMKMLWREKTGSIVQAAYEEHFSLYKSEGLLVKVKSCFVK